MLIVFPLALSGCATYTDLQNSEFTANQNFQMAREDYQRIKGQLDGLQLQIEQMQQELARVRSGPAAQVQSLQATVDQLANRLQAEESARQRDKQEIVDTLSGKITKIMSTSTPRPTPVQQQSAHKTNAKGYEHKVEAGQTISAIASAYGVKSSDILQANNISDPTKIRVGQVLFIPAP